MEFKRNPIRRTAEGFSPYIYISIFYAGSSVIWTSGIKKSLEFYSFTTSISYLSKASTPNKVYSIDELIVATKLVHYLSFCKYKIATATLTHFALAEDLSSTLIHL